MVEISPLPLEKGMLARTLIKADGIPYEVYTCNTRESVGEETAEFWEAILKDYPFETAVYRCLPADRPLSDKEKPLADVVAINDIYRRNFDLGDLYVSRSASEEAASMEHQDVIEQFKSGDVLLFTKAEREAIYGSENLLQ